MYSKKILKNLNHKIVEIFLNIYFFLLLYVFMLTRNMLVDKNICWIFISNEVSQGHPRLVGGTVDEKLVKMV